MVLKGSFKKLLSSPSNSQEVQMKKKLQGFLAEMLKLGTVKGFKYFAMYLRGREEMVISVVNHPQNQTCIHAVNSKTDKVPPDQRKLSKSESFSSNNLPYDQRSLLLSIRSQMILSTHGVKDVGLPPASPAEGESLPTDDKSTLFLIAGYSRYMCPYVWVRSNHDRLVRLTGDSSREKDCPLKLKTTLKWKDSDVFLWDIVAELVKLCTYPAPRNPFEIDFEYFSMLPLSEKVLATAAMMNVLQKILIHTPDQKQYAGQVFEELQLITKVHFQTLQELIQAQGLPVLQQHMAQAAPATRAATRAGTSSYNQPSHSSTQPAKSTSQPTSYNYGYGGMAAMY